jgi:hypothetical protein
MNALAMSRDRLERARVKLDEASASLLSHDVVGAVKRCEVVYGDLRDVWTAFKHDWQALDLLLGQIVVADAFCKRHGIKPPDRLRTLLQSALDVRLAWLAGE